MSQAITENRITTKNGTTKFIDLFFFGSYVYGFNQHKLQLSSLDLKNSILEKEQKEMRIQIFFFTFYIKKKSIK